MNENKVVILGGGFGGIACAKAFAQKHPRFEVTLLDQNPYHVIHGNLYELAASPEEVTDFRTLKQTVAVPYLKIFQNSKIKFQQSKVTFIEPEKKVVQLEHGSVPYDFLVCAFGAQANFYGIEGAEEFAMPLQSGGDALRIRDRIEFVVQAHRHNSQKDIIRLMIAGGGVAGTEVAGELQGMLNFVAWKNSYTREKLQTVIIEGSSQLLPGFDAHVVRDAINRLQDLNVEILTHRMITKVEDSMVSFSNGEKMEFDCLVWTAGVKAAALPLKQSPLVGRGDRVEVDEYFRIKNISNVWTIGDQSCHHTVDGNPLPGTASQAIDQGNYVADAINLFAQNKQPSAHTCKKYPIIIPLGGKWAIMSGYWFYVKGYLGFIIREFVWLHYFASLVGWVEAIKMTRKNNQIYSVNDN